MHTLSSASRTCMASASAVECTATVWMPSSRQARWMRSAISPRLAMRTFSNMKGDLFDHHEDFAILDRLAIAHQELRHLAGARRGQRVHLLHGLDDEQRLALADAVADLDEGRRPRLGRGIGGADHG